jgi:hypothetical protein
MRRRWLAGLVLAVLLLGSLATSADPTNWGQLAQIILWLQQIDRTLRDLNVVVDDIRGNLAQVYPEAGLRQIETLFEPVDSIKEEVEKLACNWRFTPRVEKLRLALFGGGSFCRSDWNLVFGPPPPTIDWDLESYYDWSAVRRLNLIKTRNEKGARRAVEAAWLAHEAIQGRDAWDPVKPRSETYAVYDDELRGFGVRVSAAGAGTWRRTHSIYEHASCGSPPCHHGRSATTRGKPSSFHPSMPPIIFLTRRPRRAKRAAARSEPLQCGPLQ